MSDQTQVTLLLMPGPDEPTPTESTRTELRHITDTLDKAGLTYSAPSSAAEGNRHEGAAARLCIPLVQFAHPLVGDTLTAWIAARSGRQVIAGINGLEKAIRHPAELQQYVSEALKLGLQQGGPPSRG
ncbi:MULTISPECIES: hypothetical protein [Pseudomonas]|uniref:Uncharacterized protein n=1 Tax=Pseudomonas quercus TaxID=2722792 RepID=A0ABX0YMY4_9PSED|nr:MULTISPECIES: hypothetical protein [Pseudomonas]MBF7144781.1 hypothetical protein [Pseudomonas sp. LY10J]NJP03318.1 hypothetical protein [Pseudomonas quercus]